MFKLYLSIFITLSFYLPSIYANSGSINSYIEKYNHQTFFKSNLADEFIDYEHIDLELLQASIYFQINKIRTKSRKEVFKYTETLDQFVTFYGQQYGGYYFKPNAKKKRV